MWIGHRKEIRKLTFRVLALRRIRSDEGLALETSAFKSLYDGQFTLSTQLMKPNNLVILPPTQHHSFFRDLPPLLICLVARIVTITRTKATNLSFSPTRPVRSVYIVRLSSLPEIRQNTVPFVTGNFQKLKLEFVIEWKALLVQLFTAKVKVFPTLNYCWDHSPCFAGTPQV